MQSGQSLGGVSLFIVDDLVAIALFALMGKLAYNVVTEKPNYDDDDLSSRSYRFGSVHREPYRDYLYSLNRADEEPYGGTSNLSPLSSPSRRYRFDKWTGEWDEHD